jgi:neutral ceramidase
MHLGTAEIDITPAPGVELSGFAARTQPSTGVLDPLFARGLYLADGDEKLLWLHADLIGLTRELVQSFRRWARQHLRLTDRQVLLSATHTHAGPATVHLQQAGTYDAEYVAFLQRRLQDTARAAMADTQACDVVTAEGRCDLAVDRRGKPSAHTDPRVAAIGWRRVDGTFAAVLGNYAMHAVALGPANRQISADWPGQTAKTLTEQLPGRPIALVTNGPCGNLNPPGRNASFDQVVEWGGQVAHAVLDDLKQAPPCPDASLRVRSTTISLPLEAMTPDQINAYAHKITQDSRGLAEFGDTLRRAAENWRRARIADLQQNRAADSREVELFAAGLGPIVFVGVNAEVFSAMSDLIRQQTGRPVHIVGYANGLIGYLPTAAAYDEGGYEVETAHVFYNTLRPQRGALESLARHAAALVNAPTHRTS